jgi:hypothetical protein
MTGRWVAVVTPLLIAVLAACADAGPGSGGGRPGSPASGVAGVAMVDVGCPVLEGSSPCPEVPLRARIVVRRVGTGDRVTAVESGVDGRFRVLLAPGRYELRGENLAGAAVPTAMPVPVTVRAGEFVSVTVRFDSGVRGAPGP